MPSANFFAPGQDAPAVETLAITPNDSTDLDVPCRALWVGTTGNISLMGRGDSSAVLIRNIPSGTLLPISCKRVLATSTTAADIVALY